MKHALLPGRGNLPRRPSVFAYASLLGIVGSLVSTMAVLQACGSESVTNPDGGTDATLALDNEQPKGDSSPGMDGPMDMDGAMMDGAMMDGAMMDGGGGGGGSNPGLVNCGPNVVCDAGYNGCCLRAQMDGGVNYSCQGQTMCLGSAWACDEPADCPNMWECCINTFLVVSTGCHQLGCGNFFFRACKTSNDCGDGGSCGTYTCPGNVQIHSCTKPMNCN